MPASTAIVPQVTPHEHLQQANALLGITRSIAFGIGAALGGIFVSLVSTGGAVALDACTFVVSALCLAALSDRSAPGGGEGSFLSELRTGFDEVRRHRWLWIGLINAFLFLMLVVAPFEVIGPIVSKSDLGGAFAWGVILTGFSVGTLLGGLVMLRVRFRRPMFVAGVLLLRDLRRAAAARAAGAGLGDRARLRGRGLRRRHLRDRLGDRDPAPHPARDARARGRLGLARHDRRDAARLRAHRAGRGRGRHRRDARRASRSPHSCSSLVFVLNRDIRDLRIDDPIALPELNKSAG